MRTKHYYKPTPVKWRKIGDAILFFATGVSTMVMSLPLEDKAQKWLVFSCGVIGLLGKVLTNFFTDETTTNGNAS